MERLRRLDDFWSWLPAFRAVAESEHLPTAAAAMHLSPSALSRSVRQLEESLGKPLFDRRGRRITLNAHGDVFLSAVRHAMRVVHEGVLAVEDTAWRGELTVSVPGPLFAPVVLPVLEALHMEHPALVARICSIPSAGLANALRRGTVDVAIDDEIRDEEELTVRPLRVLDHDVFCSPAHPLARGEGSLEEARFVAPPADRGQPADSWPAERERHVGLRVHRMQAAIDAVRSGAFVAVLPTLVGDAQDFVALGVPDLAPTTLHVVTRETLGLTTAADQLADRLLQASQA